MEGMDRPVLSIRNLSAALLEGGVERQILQSITFDIDPGSIVGLFGPSGCGKTTLALALLGLLPRRRYRVEGSVRFEGVELAAAPGRTLRAVRGAGISLILQDPALALNPVMRIRDQIAEPARAHGLPADPEAMLRLVGLPGAGRILDSYPHQLSGGQRQRVAIAQAFVCRPRLVIADEPFTALDASGALALADLLRDLQRGTGVTFLVISHSPGILARIADSVLMMDGGCLLQRGTPAQVFRPLAAGDMPRA
jgi:peptide/nickel transport system ATP-binding protein